MKRENPILEWLLTALWIWCLLLAFVGCKTQQPVQVIEKERIVEVHTRDTAIITKADSASLIALLQCDSAYNVVLCNLAILQGERINTNAHAQQTEQGLLLAMDCKEDSLEQIIQLRDSVIKELQKKTQVIEKPYVPNYYKNTSTGFWILLAILVIIVGWKIAKIYFKLQGGGLF